MPKTEWVENRVCPERICDLGPVFRSIVSLTGSLVVKKLTALVSTVSNSVILSEKNVSSFCKCKSYSHIFSKNISVYAIFNDQSFNDTLTNDIVSFEQLGPGLIMFLLGMQRWDNVESTSTQRLDVASTPIRRCINVMCLLDLLKPNT